MLLVAAVVPANICSGTQPVVLTIGNNNNAQQGITVAIDDSGQACDPMPSDPHNSQCTVQSQSTTDKTGATPSPSGIPIQVSPADFQFPELSPPALARMFPRPTAKVVHIYASSLP
jgi:hypothetical protein